MPAHGFIPSLPADAIPSESKKYPIPALQIVFSISSADIVSLVAKSNVSPRGVQNVDSSASIAALSISFF